MNSSDIYTAVENNGKYADVCDHTKKKNKGNKSKVDVLDAFSGLHCPGDTIHDWKQHSKQYRDNFKRAKICLQRRLTTMKKYPVRSLENKTSRQKHIYPIQVAYAYGKDCLKKIASREQQTRFKDSVDDLIKKVAISQPNVTEYFDGSIENSIRSRNDAVTNILNKEYYNDEQMNIINRERLIGYDRLNNNEQDKFLSIFEKGLNENNELNNSKDVAKNISGFKALEDGNNEENTNRVNKTYYKNIKKDLKKRHLTKKKTKHVVNNTANRTNISNINYVLQSGLYNITDADIHKEIASRIEELGILYSDYLLLQTRYTLITEIYDDTFTLFDMLNNEVISKLSNISGQSLTKKVFKTGKIDAKYKNKLERYEKRGKLSEKFIKLRNQTTDRFNETKRQIVAILNTDNLRINRALKSVFSNTIFITYLVNKVNKKINDMSKTDYDKLYSERNELYDIPDRVKIINTELRNLEQPIQRNLKQREAIIKMLENPVIKARANVFESTKQRLDTLNNEEAILEKEYLAKYSDKTSMIEDILIELSKKTSNTIMLQDILHKINSDPTLHTRIQSSIVPGV